MTDQEFKHVIVLDRDIKQYRELAKRMRAMNKKLDPGNKYFIQITLEKLDSFIVGLEGDLRAFLNSDEKANK